MIEATEWDSLASEDVNVSLAKWQARFKWIMDGAMYRPTVAFDAALKYLVSLKIFLYCPTVLPNVLFCEPQVALDKINELVGCYHTLNLWRF